MSVSSASLPFNFESWQSGCSDDPRLAVLEWKRFLIWLRTPAAGDAFKVHDLHMAWKGLVERYPWHAFTTHTYRQKAPQRREFKPPPPLVGIESNEKNFRRWLFDVLADEAVRQGLGWWKDGRIRGPWHNAYKRRVCAAHPVWVLGVERDRNGKIHCHALIRWPDMLPDVRRTRAWKLWFDRHGMGRMLPPTWQGAVSQYVTKYATKEGEVTFSRFFDRLDASKRESWDGLRVLSCGE